MNNPNTILNNVVIIGAGNLGSSLAHAWSKNGIRVTLISKDHESQRKALTDTSAKADCVLLTVQDSNIQTVCEAISPWLQTGTIVCHCSGALGMDVLETAKQAGCSIASAHPLNTFPSVESGKALLENKAHQSYCFISGDDISVDDNPTQSLGQLFSVIGFTPTTLDAKNKVAYHAACVFACNYLTSLTESSLLIAEEAGLDREMYFKAVQPLMLATLSNIASKGTAASLSGPIARGDVDTITRHLNALSNTPKAVQDAYRALGQQAVQLAAKKDGVPESDLTLLMETLS